MYLCNLVFQLDAQVLS